MVDIVLKRDDNMPPNGKESTNITTHKYTHKFKQTQKIKTFFLLSITCGFTFLLFMNSPGDPVGCTVFSASIEDAVLFGNNEDVGYKNATVWFVPSTETTYGYVYFGFHDYPLPNGHFPMGGMNDQGLCFDITSVPETIKPLPKTIDEALQYIQYYNQHFTGRLNGGVFGEEILKTCTTVEETIHFIEKYDLLFYGEYQFLFADRTGESMILCPNPQGEMEIIHKSGVYQAITNFNVLNPALGQYPCSRYDDAVRMLKKIEHEDDLAVEYFTSILKKTHSEGTTYSTLYDPLHNQLYLYNHHNFNRVVVFDLEKELEGGYHTYEVIPLFRERGELPHKGSEKSEESSSPAFSLIFAIFIIVLILSVSTLAWKKRVNRKT
jgi:hypothetical protein